MRLEMVLGQAGATVARLLNQNTIDIQNLEKHVATLDRQITAILATDSRARHAAEPPCYHGDSFAKNYAFCPHCGELP